MLLVYPLAGVENPNFDNDQWVDPKILFIFHKNRKDIEIIRQHHSSFALADILKHTHTHTYTSFFFQKNESLKRKYTLKTHNRNFR